MELRADVRWSKPNVGEGPILLQKSKIERRRKSRESRFLDVSTAARLCRPDTKVRGRFCVKRCGPTCPRVRNAPAALKNFVRQPKDFFNTIDPERTLIAEERPRQRGSEYGLRAGDSELNRCHLRRAKVGSRQLPGPIALRKGDGENARPLLCRTTRKRSFQLRPPSHSGPSSNDSFNQPAVSSTPVTSSGTLP
jgi:hypothetical protein